MFFSWFLFRVFSFNVSSQVAGMEASGCVLRNKGESGLCAFLTQSKTCDALTGRFVSTPKWEGSRKGRGAVAGARAGSGAAWPSGRWIPIGPRAPGRATSPDPAGDGPACSLPGILHFSRPRRTCADIRLELRRPAWSLPFVCTGVSQSPALSGGLEAALAKGMCTHVPGARPEASDPGDGQTDGT